MCACAANLGLPRPAFDRPLLFRAQGRPRLHRRRDLAHHRGAHQAQARGRARSRASPAGSPPIPAGRNIRSSIETLEPAGLGALMALVEERKKKLAAEGLFDAARKQLLPFLPQVIGVITSPTGAVIRDILHRLADRFPRHVLVWPVRVQGEGSAEQVAAAIRGFNALAARRRDPAARSPHRRARRRLARRPVVVQRGDRGARRGRRA